MGGREAVRLGLQVRDRGAGLLHHDPGGSPVPGTEPALVVPVDPPGSNPAQVQRGRSRAPYVPDPRKNARDDSTLLVNALMRGTQEGLLVLTRLTPSHTLFASRSSSSHARQRGSGSGDAPAGRRVFCFSSTLSVCGNQ